MLPERDNLSNVGNIHSIKGALDALVNNSRNVRSASEGSLAIKGDVNEPICDFNVWGNVEKFNHRIHLCSSESDFAIVTKCKRLQMKLFIIGTFSFRLSALKTRVLLNDFTQYATSLRVLRGVL